MSAEIVNLRQARKRKAREARQQAAEASRLAHGRSKADRQREAAKAELDQRRHEGHRLERPDEDGKP